jgi:hypothetical protein
MRYLKHVLLMFFVAALLAPMTASADQGRGRGHAKEQGAAAKEEAIVIDRDGHRRIVHEYYTRQALPPGLAKREALPPGLAKREALPPGLQKQLRERGELPPGLQKRLTRVPAPLAARLPGLPAYYSRYFAGTDLIIVDDHSNRIVSVIPNIF